MNIALQNELDNTRAQLAQKGELVWEEGHEKFPTWVLEEEALGSFLLLRLQPSGRVRGPALYV